MKIGKVSCRLRLLVFMIILFIVSIISIYEHHKLNCYTEKGTAVESSSNDETGVEDALPQ